MKRDLNPFPGYTRLSHDRADSVSNMDLNVKAMHRLAIVPSSAESDFIGLEHSRYYIRWGHKRNIEVFTDARRGDVMSAVTRR